MDGPIESAGKSADLSDQREERSVRTLWDDVI